MAIFERGDICLVNLDPTQGHEQQGIRPVLIISPKAFNQVTGLPIVLPITTGGNFARTKGFAVALDNQTKTQGIIRADQPRAIDVSARAARFLEKAPQKVVDNVLAKIATFLQ